MDNQKSLRCKLAKMKLVEENEFKIFVIEDLLQIIKDEDIEEYILEVCWQGAIKGEIGNPYSEEGVRKIFKKYSIGILDYVRELREREGELYCDLLNYCSLTHNAYEWYVMELANQLGIDY